MLPFPNRPAILPDGPPLLQVIIDTEIEFDWSQPFARDNVSVSAMEMQYLAQEILTSYGFKPTYVIDYPIATQPSSIAVLQSFLANGRCLIGSHLHPWVTPPFDEPVTAFNSYPGNLDPRLERRKLESLTTAIVETFGIQPTIYKAGRYGIGPGTADTITDFSGGTRASGVVGGTGDVFYFPTIAPGSVSNYAEQTSTSYAQAETDANGLFASNASLRFVVIQVGSDDYLFVGTDGHADSVMFIQGVGLTGIDAANFV